MTLEEREQIKAEILEEIKAERHGMNAWRKYLKDEIELKLQKLIGNGNQVYKLLQSLNGFVRISLNKGSMQPREDEIGIAKKIADVFLKAFEDAQEIAKQ